MQGMLHEKKTKEGPEEGWGADDVKEKTRVRRDQIRKRLIVFTHARFNKRMKAKVMRLDKIKKNPLSSSFLKI